MIGRLAVEAGLSWLVERYPNFEDWSSLVGDRL